MTEPTARSKEPQYQIQIDTIDEMGPVELGPTASHTWRSDPRRLTFLLSRYKFVSKMLAGRKRAVEIGCGDGFGMRVVLQTVESVHGVDFDPIFIEWATAHAKQERINAAYSTLDITKERPAGKFDSAYSLDVIEHIEPDKEHLYVSNIAAALEPEGVFICGTPNLTANEYASVWSKEGHINLKSASTLQKSMGEHFKHVFIFSMNDEVLHTGFHPMAHYLIALCVGVKTTFA